MRTVENGEIPARLPVIPLRSTVVFPMGALSMHLGMQPTLDLLSAHGDDALMVVTVLDGTDPDEEVDPSAWEGKVGVIAQLSDRLNLPGGTVQATFHGLRRMRLSDIKKNGGYYTAALETIKEQPADPVEADVIIARVLTILEALADEVERLPREVPAVLRMNVSDPGRFADLVATLTNFPPRRKDEVLQHLDVTARLQYVVESVEAEYRHTQEVRASERHQQAEAAAAGEDGQEAGAAPGAPQVEAMPREAYAAELRHRIKQLQAQLGAIDPSEREAVELLRRIDTANLTQEVASRARIEVERLRALGIFTPQAAQIREYIDWLLNLPWRRTATGGVDAMDLDAVQRAMDEDILGLDEPKERLLDDLAVAKLKGDLSGPIPCLVGPPDVGKTALVKAMARGLGRPLHRIELRGRGEAELVGNRPTRPEARPGKILQGLRDQNARDVVILLEEMDTIGAGKVEGDPASALEEVLGWSTRNRFTDRYLGIPFDLTDVMFVATAHDFFRVPHDLREMLVAVHIAGYTPEEKAHIARDRMLPRMVVEHGLRPEDVDLDDDDLVYLARGYARDAGLEGMRRALATILRTRARAKARGDGETWPFDQDRIIDVLGLPHYVSTPAEKAPEVGVVTGLAWTAAGGEIMLIEALKMPGGGQLLTTGYLGDVMQESVVAAYSYVRSRGDELGIPYDEFVTTDLHVHFPVGAVPKDGPSAGVAVMLAIASALSERPIRHDVAVTGEVTLRGKVLEVGGIKEKVLAAYRAGLREVILPAANERDLREVPDDARDGLTFHFVDRMDEVFAMALVGPEQAAQEEAEEEEAPSKPRKRAGGKRKKAAKGGED